MNKFLFFTVFVVFFTPLRATSIVSNQTGDWNSMSTWVGSVVPTSGDVVTIAATHSITVTSDISCAALTINGTFTYNTFNNVTIGSFSNRFSPVIVNGTFNVSTGYGFKIYGNLMFNTGSTFNMTSGGLNINGTTNAAVTSVASGTALLDVSNVTGFNATGGTIFIENPHFDASSVCIKGAKTFGTTISFGNYGAPIVSNNYVISTTQTPSFNQIELTYNSTTVRTVLTGGTVITGSINLINGILWNPSATPLSIKADFDFGTNTAVALGKFEFNGSSQQNIAASYLSGATQGTFDGDLIVNNPERVKIKTNIEIKTGDLIFTQGKLDVETKTLSLRRAPLNYSSSNYVVTYNLYSEVGFLLIANLTAGNTVFPVGTENGALNTYTPVTINAASGNFKVSVKPFTSLPVASFDKLNVEWNIERVFGPVSADVTVQWNTANEEAAFGANRGSSCRLFHYNGASWDMQSLTGGTTSTVGTVHTKTTPNITDFSPFTMFISAILPLEFGDFTAKSDKNHAKLTWNTLTETDNDGFEIEKSTDGKLFLTLGFEKSKGNAIRKTTYFYDDNAFTETAYYRLKQIDKNGKSSFSKIITLVFEDKNTFVKVYPTFITNENILTIEPLNTSNDADITIFDMNGQLIYHKTLSSNTPQMLGTSAWKRGLYIVKINNGKEIKAVKVIKN